MTDMLNYFEGKHKRRYCNSYVSIGFRTNKTNSDSLHDPAHVINHNNFVLNSFGDGWFRKDCGPFNKFGLCIIDLKITSRKPALVGDFICHKCEITYESNNFESETLTDKFWLFVHKEIDIKDVLSYIEQNKHEWRP